ncbi:LAGLIDADG family homing endonuclease [Sporosarcina ureae]
MRQLLLRFGLVATILKINKSRNNQELFRDLVYSLIFFHTFHQSI